MLSDGEMIQRRNIHHTASDSAPFSAYFLWPPWLARHVGRLIANARLEFSLSRSKDGLLKISNRERIAISHLAPQSRLGICLATHHLARVTRSLIYCGAIRIPRKPLKTSDIKMSNRR